MRYLLGLDQGTTSSRALLFDGGAGLLGMAQEEHPLIYPKPGWVEHDPELLWQTQVRTAHRELAEHGVCGREIEGDTVGPALEEAAKATDQQHLLASERGQIARIGTPTGPARADGAAR